MSPKKKGKVRRKPMPKPSVRHEDRRLNPKRFKDWSAFADYLYLELKRKGLPDA